MTKFKLGVVYSDYYPEISAGLIAGIQNGIEISENEFEVEYFRVFGSYEIPLMIQRVADKFDGIIAVGCVVPGKTYHHDLINLSVTSAILNLSLSLNKPISSAILMVKSLRQARQRSKLDSDNRGLEAFKAIDFML